MHTRQCLMHLSRRHARLDTQEVADQHAGELAGLRQRLEPAETALLDQHGRQTDALVQTDHSDGAAEDLRAQLEASAEQTAALRRLLDEAEDRHREELETLSRRHAETLRALQDEWQETAGCAQDEAAALQRRLAAAEAAAAQSEPAPAVGAADARIPAAASAAELEAERAAHADELDAVRTEHEATLNGLAALHEAAMADVAQAHAADLERAEARHKVTSCAACAVLPVAPQFDQAATHPCSCGLHYMNTPRQWISVLQAAFESAIKAHDAECASLVEAHAEAMAAAAMTHATEVEALRAAHAAELDLLRASVMSDLAPSSAKASEQPDRQQAAVLVIEASRHNMMVPYYNCCLLRSHRCEVLWCSFFTVSSLTWLHASCGCEYASPKVILACRS